MESMLLILLGVIALIVRVVAAANRKNQQTTRRPTHYPTPGAPSQNPLEEWLRRMQQEMGGQPARETATEKADGEYEDEIETVEAAETPAANPETPTEQKHYPQPAPVFIESVPATADTASEEEKAAFAENVPDSRPCFDMEHFDITQAVIYKEILQPKF